MKRNILVRLLALVLCALLLGEAPPARAAASFTEAELQLIIRASALIISKNEGSYYSVNADDNGAVSIGKMQWHATRALNLLKEIVAEFDLQGDDNFAQLTLTYTSSADYDTLYEEIKGETSWASRIVDDTEKAELMELLDQPESQAVQDSLEAVDIRSYVTHGISVGITDPAALVYYADIENQFGYSGAQTYNVNPVKAELGKDTIDSLTEFHETLIKVYSGYQTRRKNTYSWCIENLCAIDDLFHFWEFVNIYPTPTETSAGRKNYVCSYCEGTKTEQVPCTGAGDLTGDGYIDGEDVFLLVRLLTGIGGDSPAVSADLDDSGSVDAADLAILVQSIPLG